MGVLIELVGFMIAWFLGLYGFMVVYVCHIHELYQIHHLDSSEPYPEETLENANTLSKDTVFGPFLGDKSCDWGF